MSEPGRRSLRFARYRAPRRACGGAVAIEFALVFPIFFVLFYAIVAYGFAFTIKQYVTMAAEEGARATLRDAPNVAARLANATREANRFFKGGTVPSWIQAGVPSGNVTSAEVACPAGSAGTGTPYCFQVTVTYDKAAFPIPSLGLLNFSIVIPNMAATATVQYVQY